ncbi:MAG: hypothetical protein LBG52_02465 [Candidatus Peribacteria bacterium]|jgi:hypothetical protein|nr:hypothetical protein [Candidatus Peribacteria bacterium]
MERVNLILPKTGVKIDFQPGVRLYFLAGPIRGGGDWQKKAITLLASQDNNCYVACPCWYTQESSLREHLLLTNDVTLKFARQTLWERYYLALALRYGAIIFWLPVENADNPRAKEDGPYARETYGEIGRWSMKSLIEGTYPIIGGETGFPGLEQIQANLNEDFGYPFPIYPSLEETIKAAQKMIK